MKKFIAKGNLKKALKRIRHRKNFAANLNNLDPSFVTDNKLFLKTVKPFFSNNGCYGSQIKLIENNELLQDDSLIAKELNENALSVLNIDKNIFIINKKSCKVSASVLHKLFNESTENNEFPQNLKLADIYTSS